MLNFLNSATVQVAVCECMCCVSQWECVYVCMYTVMKENNSLCQHPILLVLNCTPQLWKYFTVHLCWDCNSQFHKSHQKDIFLILENSGLIFCAAKICLISCEFEWCHFSDVVWVNTDKKIHNVSSPSDIENICPLSPIVFQTLTCRCHPLIVVHIHHFQLIVCILYNNLEFQ